MGVVPGGHVFHPGTEASGHRPCPLNPVFGRQGDLGSQIQVKPAADDVGHRKMGGGRGLFDRPRLLLRQLDLGPDHVMSP